MAPHPFEDLTAGEITRAAQLVQSMHNGTVLSFKAITLEEPDKALMLKFLDAEHKGRKVETPPRVAYCAYYFRGTVQ